MPERLPGHSTLPAVAEPHLPNRLHGIPRQGQISICFKDIFQNIAFKLCFSNPWKSSPTTFTVHFNLVVLNKRVSSYAAANGM